MGVIDSPAACHGTYKYLLEAFVDAENLCSST